MSLLKDRLKDAREKAGLTQDELAKRARLSNQSLIGNIEAGAQKSTTKIFQIAKVLGVSPEWLSEGTGSRFTAEQKPADDYLTSSEEGMILRAFRLAPPDVRRLWIIQARGLLDDFDTPTQLSG